MRPDPSNPAPTAPLYTELPFPADGVVRHTVSRMLRDGVERHAPRLLEGEAPRIADIGCGTGELTAGIARAFPGSRVVAVDVNPASLDRARQLAERERLPIEFVRRDIASGLADALVGPAGPFHLVTSIGVLHHLADPKAGFAAVRPLVADGGLFLCYVYSRHGRRDDVSVKAVLDRGLPGASFEERARAVRVLGMSDRHNLAGAVRQLRRRLRFGPPLRPVESFRAWWNRNPLVHVSDTFSNPCEHLYEFAEVERIVRATGWDLVGLAEGGGLPTTPEAHTRSAEARALLHRLPKAALYDYFAFHYRVFGFYFFLKPR
jgi:SAM-dependent methyltransferase